MNIFAVIELNELLLRVLYLTRQVIEQNSAHYTAWYYRRVTLFHLCTSQQYQYLLPIEIEWMNYFACDNPKPYQLWQYRRNLIQYIITHNHINQLNYDVSLELQFTANIFNDVAKNYHAWSHRQYSILNKSPCNNAHSLLVECYERLKQYSHAVEHCTALIQYDCVRRPYWCKQIEKYCNAKIS